MRLRSSLAAVALAAVALPAHAEVELAPSFNFMHDWNRFTGDDDRFEDRHDFRRARVGFTVKGDSFDAKVEFDLEPQVWTDVFARVKLGERHALRAGQFKQPIGLEELTSSKAITFMERSLTGAYTVARRMGVDYQYVAPGWTATAAVYDQSLDGTNPGVGYGVRATWAPMRTDTGALHFGGAFVKEDPDANTARLRVRPEAGLTDVRLVDTGTLANVDRLDRYGVEAAWVSGPWSVQSEYLRAEVSRDVGADFSGDAWYVYGSWFPTGHARVYKNGVFDAPKLADGERAWELALRYSTIDLDDGVIEGGDERNWTAGVNWYVTKSLRFMANYVAVDSERRDVEANPNILEFRAQFAF